MSDPVQQWDDILADILVECGHCCGPMSPLPAGAAEPRYECLQRTHPQCTNAAMSALELEEYVAYAVLGEMAKPAVAEALTQALLHSFETDLPPAGERAVMKALTGVPADLNRYLDEDVFSPRWLADWWNRRAARAPHHKRQLCRAFFVKIELRTEPVPEPAALHDDRVVLHWKTWDNPAGSTGLGGTL
ncbi:hypothetical protein [Streptomyces noursei]|uniref:Uncharacterized protein n=1 Tax=Streptomyces noursei TaxID=1971 RepID=A0A2N8PR39_STRNR|nr:hypothetical protein [Streptomyces noursei]PNE43505.1 hypothetical protein AOB60_00930 [Streptomyces noursei]